MRRRTIDRLAATAVVSLLCFASASTASAALRTKEVDYKQGATPLRGFLAWDDAAKGKRPGVLLVHEWWGLNDYARSQARRLAAAGYVAFALDMFGRGKMTTHPDEAKAFVAEATKDPAAMAARFDAGMQQLKQDPHVDATRVGAIGYCFGGAMVLAAARRGAGLDAVVSFHGAIPPGAPVEKGAVNAKVLILTGGADPMVPASDVTRFESELKAAGANVRVVTYPGVKHSFTNPNADKSGVEGLQYNAQAARESWDEMLKLFRATWPRRAGS